MYFTCYVVNLKSTLLFVCHSSQIARNLVFWFFSIFMLDCSGKPFPFQLSMVQSVYQNVNHSPILEQLTETAAAAPPTTSFASIYSLSRRRRQCLSLLDAVRVSVNLSVKAVALLVYCVLLTIQRSKEQSRINSQSGFDINSRTELNFYQVLRVPQNATTAEIKSSHRKLAIRYHPDKVNQVQCFEGEVKNCETDSFIAIQQAYEVLIDPYERSRYDIALSKRRMYVKLPSMSQQSDSNRTENTAYYVRKRPAAFTTPTSDNIMNTYPFSSSTLSTASSHSSSTSPTKQNASSVPTSPVDSPISTSEHKSNQSDSIPILLPRPPTPWRSHEITVSVYSIFEIFSRALTMIATGITTFIIMVTWVPINVFYGIWKIAMRFI